MHIIFVFFVCCKIGAWNLSQNQNVLSECSLGHGNMYPSGTSSLQQSTFPPILHESIFHPVIMSLVQCEMHMLVLLFRMWMLGCFDTDRAGPLKRQL